MLLGVGKHVPDQNVVNNKEFVKSIQIKVFFIVALFLDIITYSYNYMKEVHKMGLHLLNRLRSHHDVAIILHRP